MSRLRAPRAITGRAARWAREWRTSWPSVAVAGFVAYYGAVWATGMRFTTWYVDEGWQMLPREPLVANPVTAVWYLHIQPPVWNGVVGVTLRLSPLPDALSLQLVMLVLAALAVWLAADLLARVHAHPALVVGVPLVAVLNPAVLANALEPRYELAVTVLVLLCAWLPVRLAGRPRLAFALLAWSGACLVMTRALYHPVWLACVLVLGWWLLVRHEPWMRTARLAAAPVALVALWMLKNLVVFGTFTLSSWTGMNALRSIEPMIDPRDLTELWESGRISSVGYVGPFATLDEYEAFGEPCDASREHPVLSTRLRDGRFVPVSNFNHECYLEIYADAGRDAWRLIREHPGAWVRGRWESTQAWASQPDVPADGSWVLDATRSAYRVIDVQPPGTIPVRLLSQDNDVIRVDTHYSVVATAATLAAVGLVAALPIRRVRTRIDSAPGLVAAVAIVGFTTAWTIVASIVGELGEQARFRGAIQMCALVVVAAAVVHLRRASRSPAAADPLPDTTSA